MCQMKVAMGAFGSSRDGKGLPGIGKMAIGGAWGCKTQEKGPIQVQVGSGIKLGE